ncbi:hypothetical protein [Streptomyces sp. NPDC048256]|uniref:hypothetical protein n=1 Tax=Streptomyces sp. NPDC048256 TaxID=3154613 RepID=UPI0033D59E59
MTDSITSLPAAVSTLGALPMPAGDVRPIAALNMPLDDVAAEAERMWAERDRRVAALHFEQAAARTASPSDQIAFHLDAWLVKHPDACATADDYPDWPAQFAAIKAAHSSTPEETR